MAGASGTGHKNKGLQLRSKFDDYDRHESVRKRICPPTAVHLQQRKDDALESRETREETCLLSYNDLCAMEIKQMPASSKDRNADPSATEASGDDASSLVMKSPTPAASLDVPTFPPSASRKRKKTTGPVIPRRKKPKDMPRRPLSAYNLFFRSERESILEKYRKGEEQEDFQVDSMVVTTQQESKEFSAKLFQAVARCIANRWKGMDNKKKKVFEERAAVEMEKYRKAVEEYERKMVESSSIGKRRVSVSEGTGDDDASGRSGEKAARSGIVQSLRTQDAAVAGSPPVGLGLVPTALPSHEQSASLFPAENLWGSLGASYGTGFGRTPVGSLQQRSTASLPAGQLAEHFLLPSNTQLANGLVLPGRNSLLNAVTLRQLEEQELLRRVMLGQGRTQSSAVFQALLDPAMRQIPGAQPQSQGQFISANQNQALLDQVIRDRRQQFSFEASHPAQTQLRLMQDTERSVDQATNQGVATAVLPVTGSRIDGELASLLIRLEEEQRMRQR